MAAKLNGVWWTGLLTLVLAGCGGGGGGDSSSGGTSAPAAPTLSPAPVPTATSTTLYGTLTDASTGNPVAGATVNSGGKTAVSSAAGTYVLEGLPLGEQVLQVSSSYHATTTATVQSSAQVGEQAVNTKLKTVAITLPFNPATAQQLQDPGSAAAVLLPAGALVRTGGAAPVGTATAQLTPLGVDVMPGRFSTPAGQSIETFGALQVNFTDANQNPLNLAAGKTATLRIPAVAKTGATLPTTVPLFYLDTARGLWVQEGSATLVSAGSGAYYQGTVTHFSTWNADQVMDTVFVRARVLDGDGYLLPGAVATCDGVDYAARTWAVADSQGRVAVPVKKNARMVCQVSAMGATSPRYELTSAAVDFGDTDVTVPLSKVNSITLGSAVTHVVPYIHYFGAGRHVTVTVPFDSVATPLDMSVIGVALALWEVTAVFNNSDGASSFAPWIDGGNHFIPDRPDTVQGVVLDPYKGLLSFKGTLNLSAADVKSNLASVTFHIRMVSLRRNSSTGIYDRVQSNVVKHTVALDRPPVQANGLAWLPPEAEGGFPNYAQAATFCAGRGYRLPTLEEALAFYPIGIKTSAVNGWWAFGAVWTSTPASPSPTPATTRNYMVTDKGVAEPTFTGAGGMALALCTR